MDNNQNQADNQGTEEENYGKYATLAYWDNFYEIKEDAVEWYNRYADLCDILNKYVNSDHRILHCGAGSSSKYNSILYKK